MWANVCIALAAAVAILLVIGIPLGIAIARSDRVEREYIAKVMANIRCPKCKGKLREWRGEVWGVDANPPEFSDGGVLYTCADCGADIRADAWGKLIEPRSDAEK